LHARLLTKRIEKGGNYQYMKRILVEVSVQRLIAAPLRISADKLFRVSWG
jgi:hypothetical protein